MESLFKVNMGKLLAGLMIIFSSLMVFQIKGQMFFLIFMILLIGYMMLVTKKIPIASRYITIFVIGFLFIGMALNILSDMPISYKKGSIYMTCLTTVVFIATSYIIELTNQKKIDIAFIKKCIKFMCVIQLHWTVVQYVLFTAVGIDLNQLIFVDTLGMVETASAYKIGNYFMPSGFCWHPAVLVPIVVISFFSFKSYYIRGLAVLVSLLCRNTTALICMTLCLCVVVAKKLIEIIYRRRFNRILALTIVLVLLIGVVVAYRLGIIEMIFEKIINIYERIMGTSNDHGSGDAHKRYYSSLGNVLNISNIGQILFGYGEGCSGYPFTVLYNQYGEHASWAVESDVMNMLYSRGLLGFVGYYGMLMYVAVRGFRIDYRYTVVTAIIMLGGITYNIQFDWMFMVNILLFYFVQKGINFFDYEKSESQSV